MMTDEDYERLALIEEKLEVGLELTEEEEEFYVEMVLNNGDNMLGATT